MTSSVFTLLNGLHLGWAVLEVWAIYPNIEVSLTGVTGHLLSLITRFLVLAYQLVYLESTFSNSDEGGSSSSSSGGGGGGGMNFDKDRSYWWWQYVWLSLLVMIPYVLTCLGQLWPYSSTLLFTSSNDYVQSFLNIVSPLSRLYVDKVVHEPLSSSWKYQLYWCTLLVWKLWFSYYFEVSCMVEPTLELMDDWLNFSSAGPTATQTYWSTVTLIVVRWAPQFAVFCIDGGIWYAVWQGLAGTVVGVSEGLGDIKSMGYVTGNGLYIYL